MQEKITGKFEITEIPSVNSMYEIGYNKATRKPTIVLSKKAMKFKRESRASLKSSDWSKDFKLNLMIGLDLHIIFFLKKHFNSRDTSNMIKIVEDVIFDYLKTAHKNINWNDNKVRTVTATKMNNVDDESTDKEIIYFEIKTSAIGKTLYERNLVLNKKG